MYEKKEVEKTLKNLLYDMLEYGNQENSIISLVYDEKKHECTVQMKVTIVPEDNYIGFSTY